MSLFIGKYVPALSYTIHTKNPSAKQVINFKGKNKTTVINLNILQIKTEGFINDIRLWNIM
jgi:gamma-glutamylcysteine synthetase